MTVRWQLTGEIFHEAVNRPPGERPAYLADVCGSDEELRLDVESLLRYASEGDSYVRAVVDETIRELRASLLERHPR